MADAELGEVRHQRHRIVQGKTFVELQALGRAQGQGFHRSRS